MGRMSKIWVEVVARSNVQNKDDLRDEAHIRLQHRHTQTTTPTRPILEKKTTFCRNFPFEDLELSIFCHIFATSKDTHKHTHSHIHDIHPHKQSSVFRDNEIFINKGRFNDDDRRRETKDWNIPRHRHGHQP